MAERQFTPEALAVLDQFNSTWARNSAARYLLNPTLSNALRMSFSESLSQWTNPELVAGGLSAGLVGWQGVLNRLARGAVKEGSGLAKIPVGRGGDIFNVVTKNSSVVINGIKFTGHALDQMQARGILSPSVVLDVIKNPTKVFPGNRPGTIVFTRDNLKIITNKAGDVITVIPQ